MLVGRSRWSATERQRMEALRVCAEDGEEVLCRVEKRGNTRASTTCSIGCPTTTGLRKYEGAAPLLFVRDGVQECSRCARRAHQDAPFLVEG